MTIVQILLAITIPLSIAAINAWVNITIKLTTDINQAKRTIFNFFVDIVLAACILHTIFFLIAQLILLEKFTLAHVYVIIVSFNILFMLFIMILVNKIVKNLIGSIVKRDGEIVSIIEEHSKAINELKLSKN